MNDLGGFVLITQCVILEVASFYETRIQFETVGTWNFIKDQ